MLALCLTKDCSAGHQAGAWLGSCGFIRWHAVPLNRTGKSCDTCRWPDKKAGLHSLNKPSPPVSVAAPVLCFCSSPRVRTQCLGLVRGAYLLIVGTPWRRQTLRPVFQSELADCRYLPWLSSRLTSCVSWRDGYGYWSLNWPDVDLPI